MPDPPSDRVILITPDEQHHHSPSHAKEHPDVSQLINHDLDHVFNHTSYKPMPPKAC
jgi:hypothetical protein